MTTAAGPSIRITAGNPDAAEVAAVTVALLAVAAAGDGCDDDERPVTWPWLGGFQSPTSWAAGEF